MKVQHGLLALGMLISGSLNTIFANFQNTVKFANDSDEQFKHPIFQTALMFIGEVLCLIAYITIQVVKPILQQKNQKQRGYTSYEALETENDAINSDKDLNNKTRFQLTPRIVFLFALPALCDTTATSLMFVGLLFTYASVYQMLRGIVVVFTGILSFFFLKRKLLRFHLCGMGFVVLGIALVGLASVVSPAKSAKDNPILGDICVIAAQLVVAVQFVLEEKFLNKYNVPALLAVGFEGVWGVLYTTIILTIMHYVPELAKQDDVAVAWDQITRSNELLIFVILGIFSISFFNFFGLTVTAQLSSVHRLMIDTMRTLVVWVFTLMTPLFLKVAWENVATKYIPLQVIGFIIMVVGAALYNEVFRIPSLFVYPSQELKEEKN